MRTSPLFGTSLNLTESASGDQGTRQATLTKQFKALQTEIEATTARLRTEVANSADARRDAQLLAQLTGEQANVSLQLDKIKQDLIADQAAGSGSSAVTALIIQTASPATGPGLAGRVVTWTVAGSILAAAAAGAVLLVRRRRSPYLRARDALADAVGSPVLADVQARPQRSVAEWLAFFEEYQATAVEAWAFRRAFRALVPPTGQSGGLRQPMRLEHPSSLVVVSFHEDDAALAVGPQLATFAASLGITTRCMVAAGHDYAAALSAACTSDRADDLRPGLHLVGRVAPELATSPDPAGHLHETMQDGFGGGAVRGGLDGVRGLRDDEVGQLSAATVATRAGTEPWTGITIVRRAPTSPGGPSTAEHSAGARSRAQPGGGPIAMSPTDLRSSEALTILIVVVDRHQPTLLDIPASAATVLAISPGVGSREDLARLAVAVDDTGRRVDGILVADPDPEDRTSGRFTLDKRARQEPLPMRATGIGQVPKSDGDRRRRL